MVNPADLRRLCEHLGLEREAFLERYAEMQGGKIQLRAGEDGACVFFREGVGCGVHDAKPNVCRAWPFFRGNLIDPVSWEMAQDYCPGINAQLGHAEFARQGLAYLTEQGLLEVDPDTGAWALCLDVSS